MRIRPSRSPDAARMRNSLPSPGTPPEPTPRRAGAAEKLSSACYDAWQSTPCAIRTASRQPLCRALAGASDGLDRAALAKAVQAEAADRPAGWFDGLLARLESEGMVAAGPDGRLRLPG